MTTEVSDSVTTTTVDATIQNPLINNQNPQGQADDKVSKEEYLNAQAFGTKARQNEIAMATRLAQKDSKELHAIEDSKVKDAVTKSLLWMSYAEASAVLGANFDITASNDDKSGDEANDSQVIRKLKLLEYKDAQREKDSAMSAFIAENPEMFKGNATAMKEHIEKELEFISSSLPISERIRRAATTSLWNPLDKQSLAYNLLLNWVAGKPNGSTSHEDEAKINEDRIRKEIRAFLGKK